MRKAIVLLVIASLSSCTRKSDSQADAGAVAVSELPKLSLTKDRRDLVFTFVDDEGRLRDVDSFEKVPEPRRKQVLVRDLSKRPEELKADQYVFVADLTREENGAWPYAIVSRYQVDRSIKEGDFAAEEDDFDDAGQRQVIVYGTSWCGACTQARSWLQKKGIPFVDKDVEEDPKAQREMARKMKRAGMQLGGVPVIDVRGKLMLGFDPNELERLLRAGP
ncbi:MAG: glutaredoxin family protein [Myxococcales bacterium]